MAADDHKIVPLTEGQVTKGGHNPPNQSTARPPAPQGSGGADVKNTSNSQTREQR